MLARSLVALSLALVVLAPHLASARGACPPGTVRVRGGVFRPPEGARTTVRTFCMDATEVTAAAYARCADAGACSAERLDCGSAATFGKPDAAAQPVNCVDWFEADAYCRAYGKRLPTEAEWEWAARGGARGWTYPWGDAAPGVRACWDGDGNAAGKGNRKGTCRVASHPRGRSADGIHDLGGNVREWTATAEERFRVLRGGSWGDSLPEFLGASFRGWNAPDERMELIGFRCVAAVGAKLRTPRRRVARAVKRDDGVIELPFEIDPSRSR